MSLLSVVRRASVLLSLDSPAAVETGGKIVQQLCELARMDAEDLAFRHDWQELEADHVFQTVAAEQQTSGLPPDFLRFSYGGDVWNRSRNERIAALSRESWQSIKAGGLGGIYSRVRISGNALYLVPAPAADEVVAFPYISSKLYATTSGELKTEWTVGADVCRLPEKLIALGVVWRWRQIKGFAYAEDMANYERQLAQMIPDGPPITIGGSVSDGIPYAWPGVLGPQA